MAIQSITDYCSTLSREAEVQLYGTATRVDVWLLLEHTGAWGRDAFKESDLPDVVKAHINRALGEIPGARHQLIKQDPPYELPRITFSVAICRDEDPALYSFEFDECEDIASLDIVDIVRNEASYQRHRSTEPMVLICTNAKRDRCCALRGLPVYGQTVELLGTSVWRTTHLGGHRFAATGVILPEGVVYGRIDDAGADQVIHDVKAKNLHLPALRGRCYYPPEAQAAEYFLRTATGITYMDAYRLESIRPSADHEWEISFAETGSPKRHLLRVARTDSEITVPASCGADPEPSSEYHLLGHDFNPENNNPLV
jgi:hypothetical protein